MKKIIFGIFAFVFSIALFAVAGTAHAATNCTFTLVGTTMTLDADCTTDVTILVPDEHTLDGKNHTITAVDPVGGFLGAVVKNDGLEAHVKNLTVTTDSLANACKGGDDRLRGIMFEGASGSIMHNNVMNINKGASGCQEGNAIEVRNAPFDDTHTDTLSVEVAHNTVTDYQKTGILANGAVDVNIHHNKVGASATQANLAANSIQLGFYATGAVTQNQIDGNSWHTPSAAATAVLVYLANNVTVSNNNIGGNSDIGIYFLGDNGVVHNNRVFDKSVDGSYDIGIGNWGLGNTVSRNVVRGFDIPYDGVDGGRNITVPGPQSGNPSF